MRYVRHPHDFDMTASNSSDSDDSKDEENKKLTTTRGRLKETRERIAPERVSKGQSERREINMSLRRQWSDRAVIGNHQEEGNISLILKK